MNENRRKISEALNKIKMDYNNLKNVLTQKIKLSEVLNPEKFLKQGYAIVAGEMDVGKMIKITTFEKEIEAKINKVKERN